jgi:DNA repair exonuclease SbcCD ATPase subunit
MDMQRTTLEQRLTELRAELTRGQEHMAQLDLQRQDTRDTLLRISGAIQVLEELLGAQAPVAANHRRNGHAATQDAAAAINPSP